MDRILIADSDVVALEQCTTMLQDCADTIVTVTDGAQALTKWRQTQPQVIVLAATLPDINCAELIQELRQTALRPSSPKILLTAPFEQHDAVQQGLAAGADDFIWKPHPQRELIMRVRRFLHEQQPNPYPESTGSAEAVLRLSDEGVRNIITATPIGICITDDNGFLNMLTQPTNTSMAIPARN
ncbi:MAG: response regulator transcription factor [Candidatus Competibacteraceae bacterium]|nr:response regulator transcription factor [Candidatus Competibacteraceae bacterium]